MHVLKALHKKEDRPERGEKVTFDKGGTVFTSDDFVEQLERIEGQKEAKAMAKAARASRKALVKRAKEEAAAEWEKIKERHVADVKEWERAVQECQIRNLSKKQYPKKPIQP